MILRTRILGLAALLALLFLSLIGYALMFFSSASAELNRIVVRNLAVERTTETLNSTILQIRSDIWDTMVFDLEHRGAQVDRLNTQAKVFYQGLRELADRDPEFTQTSQELRVLFQGYYQFGSTILELGTLEDFVGESQLVQKFRENQAALLAHLSDTLAASKEQFFGAMDRLNAEFSSTTFTAFGLAGLVTLISFVVAVLMARRLSRPLERLTATVHLVSGGDYTVRPPVTSSGEIRDLTETFVSMLDQIEDYSTRMEDLVRARTDALVRTNAVMVKELKLAQKIQDALIPHQRPVRGPLSWSGAYLPMEDLGGDFYDVFEGAPGEWTLVMADVSGHGVPAALVTAMVKISLGLHGPQTSNPGQVLEEVNRELCAAIGDLKRYATMVLCHLDLNQGTLAFCNAGHNELIVLRHQGVKETYGPNSGVVGLKPDELFLTRTIPFGPGDSLVLFTDGLIEARDKQKREFGLARLLNLITHSQDLTPDALVERLRSEVLEFSAGSPRQDDIAFLAVRREAETPSAGAAVPHEPAVAGRTPGAVAEEYYRNKDFGALLTWTEAKLAEDLPFRDASRLYHWKAMALHHRGWYDDAMAAWDQALLLDPENHRARRNRSFLERHLKEARP